ncbi:MAG: hypothetical protein KDB00_12100, partial [Planctomycetales bacterium]|nr:hypothetical protein [Planctomycetales bacterium]
MKFRIQNPAWCLIVSLSILGAARGDELESNLKRLDLAKGIVAVVGMTAEEAEQVIEACRAGELIFYCQTPDEDLASDVRRKAHSAGLLGQRLFIETASNQMIHLGDNVADRIVVLAKGASSPPHSEVLRALRPRGIAFVGQESITKPVPEGGDDWSHPYHGPDNNPNSDDKLVSGSLRTQFIGYPKFSPMPEQTVIAGGRIYKAMGHIAHKANQNEMLNTLLCINAYNGTILWRRPLSPGFMLHRNTMVATDDALYMGDHESCKIIDGETGQIWDEIRVDGAISDGPVWKWMAMRHGILFALVGNPEAKLETQRAIRRGLGHWPWGMWDG